MHHVWSALVVCLGQLSTPVSEADGGVMQVADDAPVPDLCTCEGFPHLIYNCALLLFGLVTTEADLQVSSWISQVLETASI